MDKTQVIHARIEPKLKLSVEAIFSRIGLSTTDAIKLFFKQVELQRGLPFDVKLPNKESRRALSDAKKGKLKRHATLKAFKDSLDTL